MSFYLFHYVLSLFLTSLGFFILGIFVYFKNPKSKVNRSFFLLSLSISIWSGFQMGVGSTDHQWLTIACMRPMHIGIIFIPSLFYAFVYNLLELKKKKVLKIGYFLSFLFLPLLPSKLFIIGIKDHMVLKYSIQPGPFYIWFVVFFISYMMMMLVELFKAYVKSKGARRNQLKYLFWAVFIGSVTGSTNFLYIFNVELPLWFPFITYGVILFALVTTYTIVKYRLMDISVVIKRTVVYGAIYSLSVAIFALLTIFLGQWLVYGHMDRRFYLLSMLSILIITLILRPLDNLLSRLTDKYLFRKKYEYQKTLKDASQGMTRITNLPKLLNLFVRTILNSVQVTHVTIFLLDREKSQYVAVASRGRDRVPLGFIRNNASSQLIVKLTTGKESLVYEEIVSQLKRDPKLNADIKSGLESIAKEMQDLNASVCIPSFIENKMMGFLMLGEKLSGDMYTQEDLDLFSTLANQAALAIENAQSYEELKDTRDQLLQSERLATIGKFANEVAHEIKNPLQAIKTFVEYAPIKRDDKKFIENFSRVAGGEIERINAFVKQLVGFSKPKPLNFQPVDINQLLDATTLLLENDFKKKRISVKRKYFKQDILFLADKNQIKQIFLNLLLNSIEAMDERKTNQLSIETMPDSNKITVKITDTGCGISKEEMHHLFEPFFSTKQSGAGLGLTIVKNIVENHNGEILVKSSLEEGTEFTLKFPLSNK